jgi:uncharacterized protein YcgI (DUF1989 family)
MPERLLIAGGTARKLYLERGQRLTVKSPQGSQVGDLIVFNRQDLTEFSSPVETRGALLSLYLTVGDALYSNRGRPMLRLVEDAVGVHDLLAPACNDFRYRVDYGVANHRNCVDNFALLMTEHGFKAHQLPAPLNVFEAVPVAGDGSLGIVPSPVRPGGSAVFQAEFPCIVCVCACPQDLAPTNNFRVTDLELMVSE